MGTPEYIITVQKYFDLCVKQSLGSEHHKRIFHLCRLAGPARQMWACPRTRHDVQRPDLLPTKRGAPPILMPINRPPTKCLQCPLGGSPGPAESLPASSRRRRAQPSPEQVPRRPGRGRPGRRCGARLRSPARISSDLRAPLLAERGKLPAYGGGQGKVISIRRGSLRSQANTDKLCNTGSRRSESFILLGGSQPRLCRKPVCCHLLPIPRQPWPPPLLHLPSLSGF